MIGEQVTWPTQQWSTHPCVRIKRAGVSNSHSAPTEVSRDSSSSPGGLILTETSDGPTKPDQELTRRHAFCLHLSPLLFVTFPSSQVKCYSPNEPYSILQCRAMAPRRYAVPPGSSTPAANDTPYDRTWVILSALLSTCSAGEFSRRPCVPLSAALLMPARPLAFSLLTGAVAPGPAVLSYENECSPFQQLIIVASRPFAARLAESLLISRDCEQIQKHKLSKQMII